MIKGVGIDIVSISRIRRMLLKWDEEFLRRFFTEKEIQYIKGKSMSFETIGGIFGSKEAVSKVFGTGIRNMSLKDIEVLHDNLGKPYINLYGGAKEIAEKKGIDKIEISISHERENIVSFAIGYGKKSIEIDLEIKKLLPKRNEYSHKGSYGKLGIVAGSKGMTGANYLATMSALRTGSGLVYSIVPESILEIMSMKLIEAIVVPLKDNQGYFSEESIDSIKNKINDYNSLVIGPGLGYKENMRGFVEFLIEKFQGPILLDADGLNLVSGNIDILKLRNNKTVLTPHPGEFARLTGRSIQEIENSREKYSVEFSKKHGVITILKGHKTIVTDGEQIYINNTGNAGMATAGSGDILSGIIGSFMSQGIEAFDASTLGVYVHGLAGDICKENLGEYGMIARDIIEEIPKALNLITT